MPRIERTGPTTLRIGNITIDRAAREIRVTGTVNAKVQQLEFVANTPNGLKAYESALTLDTSAIAFNVALTIIGLDKAHARNVPRRHFDPATPEGDEVELWVECPGGECQRVPAERLLYDREKKAELTGGAWVYTGSSFIQNGPYWAEMDGVLIGFVHDPSSIIEYTGAAGLNRFGAIVMNPNLGLKEGGAVVFTLRAIAPRSLP